MPVEFISGYPCKSCGGCNLEVKKERTYFWVDFGILLVEDTTHYICESCKSILIQVIQHKEEKYD